ncbi:MAG TPA: OsmC family protein [Myxococcaceae bacterium]|nr:OsmC family protein [Myxococcaceae bacterium]
MPTRQVVVDSGPGLTQTIVAGPHVLQADEPVASGGEDAGPNPYELLLASLGACTSMTLRLYANHKDWPLDRVTVRLEHWKVQPDTRRGGGEPVDEIKRVVVLVGDLSAEQRDRLLDVAGKCPVSRTLARSVRIATLLGTEP